MHGRLGRCRRTRVGIAKKFSWSRFVLCWMARYSFVVFSDRKGSRRTSVLAASAATFSGSTTGMGDSYVRCVMMYVVKETQ